MEKFLNGSTVTSLAASIDASQTTLTVASSTDFDPSGPGNFRIRIEDEIMIVTNISHPTWTVVRGAEGSVADVHPNATAVNYTLTAGAIEQYRMDGYGCGVYASKPAIAQAGMRYFCTDAPYLLHYNGTTWKHFGPIWPIKRPVESECTWENQGSCTFVNQTFIAPVTGSMSYRGLYQALPSSSAFSVEGLFTIPESPDLMGEYWGAGVYIRDAAGQGITWGLLFRNSGGAKGDVIKWNSPTSFNASYWTLTSQLMFTIDIPHRPIWYRIHQTGGSRYYQFGADGFHWMTWHTTADNNFITTPSHGGFYIMQGHATLVPAPTFLHFKVY